MPEHDLLLLVLVLGGAVDEVDALFQLADYFQVAAVRVQTLQQGIESGQVPAPALRIVFERR